MLNLPKGVQFGFASISATPLAVTGFTRANPTVATGSTAAAGSVVLVNAPGWSYLDQRVTVTDANKALVGLDATDTVLYPGTSGAGSVQVAGTFTNFQQGATVAYSGGDQQYWQGQILESRSGRQISLPTYKNAKTITLTMYYDAALGYYAPAKRVDALGESIALRCVFGNGDALYWLAQMSFDGDPTIDPNTPMTNVATFSLLSDSTLVKAVV